MNIIFGENSLHERIHGGAEMVIHETNSGDAVSSTGAICYPATLLRLDFGHFGMSQRDRRLQGREWFEAADVNHFTSRQPEASAIRAVLPLKRS
jgi:hypothetical protein